MIELMFARLECRFRKLYLLRFRICFFLTVLCCFHFSYFVVFTSKYILGLCALSINNDNCYLAYPGSATIGEVQVFDTINLVRVFVKTVSLSKDVVFGNDLNCSKKN